MKDAEVIELIKLYANVSDLKDNLEKELEKILKQKISENIKS